MSSKDLRDQLAGLFSGLEDPSGVSARKTPTEQFDREGGGHQEKQEVSGWGMPMEEIALSEAPEMLPLSQTSSPRQICAFLGLGDDQSSRFSYPEAAHCCFAAQKVTPISLEHQESFCFTSKYYTCARFVELPAGHLSVQPASLISKPKHSSSQSLTLGRAILWVLAGVLASLVIIFLFLYFSDFITQPSLTGLNQIEQVEPSPTLTPTLTPLPTENIAEVASTPTEVVVAMVPTATVTPIPGSKSYTISPEAGQVGWVVSGEERGNHFGDSFLYAGVFKGQIYQSGFQLDLKSIPRGAPIYSASIQITGLKDDRLAKRNDLRGSNGVWSLRLLSPEVDQDWARHDYQTIFNTSVLQTLEPLLSDRDLAVGNTNVFTLSSAQIKILETRIVEDEEPKVSFRLEGPIIGPDNLFAWDTGYGPKSEGNKVALLLNVGPPPATPPALKYVVVTSTPTPGNVATAAALVLQATAEATRIGTATPVPPNVVTATPIPDYLIVTPTPAPENAATAQAMAAQATFEALTTGTPAPLPTNAVTATPTPSETPTPIPNFVMITATPTAETIFAAATQAAAATALAQTVGTPTPLPTNWVTPIVVTNTPTPVNDATAQALVQLATAQAFTTGTPTATPGNVVTATPTPVYISIPLILTRTVVVSASIPRSIPPVLMGKILFYSDRETVGVATPEAAASSESTIVYVYDPATGELGRLSDPWPYAIARERDSYSADTVYQTYTKQLLWTNIRTETGNIPTTELAIHFYDFKFKVEKIVTKMGAGIVYEPVWSPINNQIAFVATESGNDEIWVINYDGTDVRQLTHNTWEWDKSPSWSPNGKQIVFMSNRTGNQQLWIMNTDGSDQRLLLGWDNWTPYNDWGPVWVKYLDPPPPPDQPR